jgi:ADP-ribose pyrophosphatase
VTPSDPEPLVRPWQVLSSRELLDRPPWLRVLAERVRLPNGHEMDAFYRIEMPDWAQVFAVTDDGRVPMVEHYKHGPRAISLELPAGYLDPGEEPLQAAQRELREEVGVEAARWRLLGRFFVDGNRGCGATYVFLAEEARRVADPQREASEIMALHWLPLAEVRAGWRAGRLRNLGTLAAVGLALDALESDHAADPPRPAG